MSSTDLVMGAAGNSGAPATYVDDVFSTYLYTSNGSSITVNNGIDLAGKGGLCWFKTRSNVTNNCLIDTVRGNTSTLISNDTSAAVTAVNELGSFNSNGFTLPVNTVLGSTNFGTGRTYVSWTFRKQPKFFDVVTWTGNGVGGRTISHNLGSVPGMIFIKATNLTRGWAVCARADNTTTYNALSLNTTNASGFSDNQAMWSSTTFSPTLIYDAVGNTSNSNGTTYVAYLFAHDAGGFGAAGTDNVISCGSVTVGASGFTNVNLGYEPQFLLIKRTNGAGNWFMYDVMRGITVNDTNNSVELYANSSSAESVGDGVKINATGFEMNSGYFGANPHIYMAIRRPMKPPTSGTEVFSPQIWTGNDTARNISGASLPTDFTLIRDRSDVTGYSFVVNDRLRGSSSVLRTWATDAETTGITTGITSFNMSGISLGTDASNYGYNKSSNPEVGLFFTRRPGFFDEVCYTGTGSIGTQSHNLGVVPEMMIVKCRDTAYNWTVYHKDLGNTNRIFLNTTGASIPAALNWNNTTPTSNVFYVREYIDNNVNGAGGTYVAYLFATCAGVSKVGSYTGTGTTQTINCGFTAGARFVLIKRTDSTGNWYVWDSARGIVAGNDPYLLINSTAAEVTSTDYIDPVSSGFEISSTAPAAINASGGSYIYLAIA